MKRVVKRAKLIVYKSLLIIKVFGCFISDFFFYIKHSLTVGRSKHKAQARIMLAMHGLEKGLSFSKKKEGWGKDKALVLTLQVSNFIEKYGRNEISDVAVNILFSYLQDTNSTHDISARQNIEKLIEKNRIDINNLLGGTKEVEIPKQQISFEDVCSFYQQRRSVRNFSKTPISQEEIDKALKIALTTPSACNRQTCRVHTYTDKGIINKLIQNQLGDQGWTDNASVLFVITAHQSYFGGTYERHQALIDGGMFAMNFVMGLHAQNIASCYKMFVREPSKERKFKYIGNIDQAEIPIVLIFAGHYSNEKNYSPISHRLNLLNK